MGIVSSGNPHDASSAHSNVALRLAGEALRPLLLSELRSHGLSGWRGDARFDALLHAAAPQIPRRPLLPRTATASPPCSPKGPSARRCSRRWTPRGSGDRIDIAQFYLSERRVIDALLAAARRGAAMRVLLDPNKDAFGFEKSGLPNREVASELIAASDGAIRLRWYRTHGEQFHAKLAAVRQRRPAVADCWVRRISRAATWATTTSRPMWSWTHQPAAHCRPRSRTGSRRCGATGRAAPNTPPTRTCRPNPRRAATGCTGSWKPAACLLSDGAGQCRGARRPPPASPAAPRAPAHATMAPMPVLAGRLVGRGVAAAQHAPRRATPAARNRRPRAPWRLRAGVGCLEMPHGQQQLEIAPVPKPAPRRPRFRTAPSARSIPPRSAASTFGRDSPQRLSAK